MIEVINSYEYTTSTKNTESVDLTQDYQKEDDCFRSVLEAYFRACVDVSPQL